MSDQFKETFREEAYELLNGLENSLLELEDDPENETAIDAVFRAMHTIKGSAAMFGFQTVSEFAHSVENVLDRVRDGTMAVSQRLIDLTLSARDQTRRLMEEEDPEALDQAKHDSDEIVRQLNALVEEAQQAGGTNRITEVSEPGEDLQGIGQDEAGSQGLSGGSAEAWGETGGQTGQLRTYRIRFRPNADLYESGTRPLGILRELSDMGEYTVVPHLDRVPQLSQFDPEQCLIGWDVILTTKSGEQEVRDAFMFVEDRAEVIVEQIDDLSVYEEGAYKRLGEILAERGAAPRETIESTAQQQRRLGEMLVDEGVAEDEVQSALAEQQHVQRTRERVQSELSTSSIRVSSEKLDNLVDLVGEIVTLQARLSSTAQETGLSSVQSIAESFERLTDELRDSTMSIRMVPLGSTFTRFRRVVRDLSQELGKEVELVTTGGDTELDKTVIDKLNDPLVHVIRNAIDHGLESPQAREEAGKSRKGTVRLSAEYAGATVIVRIVDDGRGMDRDAIAQKAVDRGVVESTSGLSEEEIFKLIFEPGFSTAENVTSVSGRGVGMDVVKREIENLGGGVRVQSRQGQGTEIALEIPLTLAIIDGLLVQLGEEYYVFPLGAVEECIELDEASQEDESILSNRGEALPYRRLRSLFRIAGEVPERQQIVVTSTQSGKVGFVVDKVLGDMQTVIKNLGRVFRDLDGMSGATILGDGSVALILDVQRLIVMSGHGQQAAASA